MTRRFSEEYFEVLDNVRDAIAGISAQIVGDESFPKKVPGWLFNLFHIIRATTPVLQHAYSRAERRDPEQPFNRALRDFYRTKLEEEAGHDEMLVKDLERFGVSRQQLLTSVPPASISALIGSQYYLIDVIHPAAYLGYIGLLEGYPAKPEQLEELIRRSGASREAWSTYQLHAEVDTWHREELEQILDQVSVDDGFLRQIILSNGIRSGEFYCQSLEELRDQPAPA